MQNIKRPRSHQQVSGTGEMGNTADSKEDGIQLFLVQSAQLYGCSLGHVPPQLPHTTQKMVSIAFVKYLMLSVWQQYVQTMYYHKTSLIMSLRYWLPPYLGLQLWVIQMAGLPLLFLLSPDSVESTSGMLLQGLQTCHTAEVLQCSRAKLQHLCQTSEVLNTYSLMRPVLFSGSLNQWS